MKLEIITFSGVKLHCEFHKVIRGNYYVLVIVSNEIVTVSNVLQLLFITRYQTISFSTTPCFFNLFLNSSVRIFFENKVKKQVKTIGSAK